MQESTGNRRDRTYSEPGGKEGGTSCSFHENLLGRSSEEVEVFVYPSQYFTVKFREIFTDTKINNDMRNKVQVA